MYEKPNIDQPATSGPALLRNPSLNRGTGFSEAQRDEYNCAPFCRRMGTPQKNRSCARPVYRRERPRTHEAAAE